MMHFCRIVLLKPFCQRWVVQVYDRSIEGFHVGFSQFGFPGHLWLRCCGTFGFSTSKSTSSRATTFETGRGCSLHHFMARFPVEPPSFSPWSHVHRTLSVSKVGTGSETDQMRRWLRCATCDVPYKVVTVVTAF